jgi:4-amino-4-deoxy-L-arabinose transferase-like glycosyltransferase
MHRPGLEGPQAVPEPAGSFPRSLLACLPFIWSRVLFPGTVAPATRLRWRALLILIAVPGLLLYPCLSFHLFEPDEGRYAEVPREMLARGEWVIPYLQGEPYLDKPPLFYWLVMLSYRAFGIHDWSARLVPALAIHGCVLVTYLLGRRMLGERAAFWGALALGLAPGFISMGRLLVLDGLLTFWVVLSLFAAFEAVRGQRLRWEWWLLAAVACGLGVLTKGPIAVLLLVPPLWLHARLTGKALHTGWLANLALVAVILAVALPWYLALTLRRPQFAAYFLWEHNVVRFLSPFDHLEPFWYYGPILLAGFLPGTLLLVPFLRYLLSGRSNVAQRRCPELGFVLLAGGWCVLFFTLSGCKLPTYILPAFPLLALALGYYLAGSRWEQSRWTAAAVGAAIVLLGLAHFAAVPWYAHYHSPWSRPDAVQRYCADPRTPVVCYPRNCDSVSFYLSRDDLRSYRSKETPEMIAFLMQQPRTVMLFTHRHALKTLQMILPPELQLTDETPLCHSVKREPVEGLCYMAIVQRRGPRP